MHQQHQSKKYSCVEIYDTTGERRHKHTLILSFIFIRYLIFINIDVWLLSFESLHTISITMNIQTHSSSNSVKHEVHLSLSLWSSGFDVLFFFPLYFVFFKLINSKVEWILLSEMSTVLFIECINVATIVTVVTKWIQWKFNYSFSHSSLILHW